MYDLYLPGSFLILFRAAEKIPNLARSYFGQPIKEE